MGVAHQNGGLRPLRCQISANKPVDAGWGITRDATFPFNQAHWGSPTMRIVGLLLLHRRTLQPQRPEEQECAIFSRELVQSTEPEFAGHPFGVEAGTAETVHAGSNTPPSWLFSRPLPAHSPGISNRHLVPSVAKESSTAPPNSKGISSRIMLVP